MGIVLLFALELVEEPRHDDIMVLDWGRCVRWKSVVQTLSPQSLYVMSKIRTFV